MEYPPKTLPAVPPGGVTCGIDWANDDHAVCVADMAGKVVQRFIAEHTGKGLAGLVRRLRRAGAGEVAIERPDGTVVETLLEAGFTVVVISPNQLKNLRGRYGSAGSKDDRFDSFVLADTLRTDRARLRPLLPDSPATVTLRQACRARKDLVRHRVAVCNQLRAHLKIAFPGAVGLFAVLDSPVSLAFLARFDCQDRAGWLSPRRLAAWLEGQGYCGRKGPRGTARPPGRRTPRRHRRRRSRQGAHHPRPARRPGQPRAADQGPERPDRRAARPARRRAHLHLAAPLRHCAGRPAACRDRRLPGPVPHP
jgi:hypothetical protein